MFVVHVPVAQLAIVMLDQQVVGTRTDGKGLYLLTAKRFDQQVIVCGGVVNAQLPLGIQAEEYLAALFRLDQGNGVALLLVKAAHPGQLRVAIATHHKPLRQATTAVADNQRDAAQHETGRGHRLAGAFQHAVAAIQLAALAQRQHVNMLLAIDHIHPLPQRVDQNLAYVAVRRFQRQRALVAGFRTGHQVAGHAYRGAHQLTADAGSQHQTIAVAAHGHLAQRAALLIQGDRRIAIGKGQARGNQAHIIGIGHLVVVLGNQHLAIAQADDKATGIGGFDAEAGHFHASRNRQLLLQKV